MTLVFFNVYFYLGHTKSNEYATSRWVPHFLTEKNRQDRVSICQYNLQNYIKADFWLSDRIKSHLGEHLSAQCLVTDITRILASIDKKEFQKKFDKWLERMELCIKNEGDYFEHLFK